MSKLRLMVFLMLPLLLIATGCSSKKNLQKDVNALQAQVAVLGDEVARLDQSLQEKGAAPAAGGEMAASSGESAGGPIYKTPSGFQLPAMQIQQALKNAGYYNGPIDGKIGAKTEQAVKAFQRDNGLGADGVVGRNTWAKLKTYVSGNVK